MLAKAIRTAVAIVVLVLAGGETTWARSRAENEPADTAIAAVSKIEEYNEAPVLTARVALGELPSVEERLPEEPAVLEPEEMIGRYGGTVRVFILDLGPRNDWASECGATLLWLLPDGSGIEGNIAKDYEISDGGRVYTLYLREGAKWSDGQPFTADDIVFQFEDILWDEVPDAENRLPLFTSIKKLDDYAIELSAEVPCYGAELLMAPSEGAGWRFFKPRHYLSKWHIRYNPDADRLAKDEGFGSWPEALAFHMNGGLQTDLHVPTMAPWKAVEQSASGKRLERNPYYWKVDTAGNQLPYIDFVSADVINPELYPSKITSGEADAAWTYTDFTEVPLYRKNSKEAGYRVIGLDSPITSWLTFSMNQNHPDPLLRAIYQSVEFRRAVSLAINREEINDALFYGMGTAAQATAHPNAAYFREEWGKAWALFDPDRASQMLDLVGLDKRDADGFRLYAQDKPFIMSLEWSPQQSGVTTALLEMIISDWEDVGIKSALNVQTDEDLVFRSNSSDHGVILGRLSDFNEPSMWLHSVKSNLARGGSHHQSYAWEWGIWMNAASDIANGRKALADFNGAIPGEEPPEHVKEYNRWVDQWAEVPYLSKEYVDIAQKIFDYNAEYVNVIGTVGMVPYLFIAKSNIGNVPLSSWAGFSWKGSLNMVTEQLFFKD